MTRLETTRRAFLETLSAAGSSAAGTLAAAESARSSDSERDAQRRLPGHRRPLPDPDEVAGQGPRASGSRPSATSTMSTSTRAKKLADPKASPRKHYREILDRKDIDAVLIGSPDHWHVPMAVDACNAGKDVYVEKPLTHDPAEGTAIIDAQNRNSGSSRSACSSGACRTSRRHAS